MLNHLNQKSGIEILFSGKSLIVAYPKKVFLAAHTNESISSLKKELNCQLQTNEGLDFQTLIL